MRAPAGPSPFLAATIDGAMKRQKNVVEFVLISAFTDSADLARQDTKRPFISSFASLLGIYTHNGAGEYAKQQEIRYQQIFSEHETEADNQAGLVKQFKDYYDVIFADVINSQFLLKVSFQKQQISQELYNSLNAVYMNRLALLYQEIQQQLARLKALGFYEQLYLQACESTISKKNYGAASHIKKIGNYVIGSLASVLPLLIYIATISESIISAELNFAHTVTSTMPNLLFTVAGGLTAAIILGLAVGVRLVKDIADLPKKPAKSLAKIVGTLAFAAIPLSIWLSAVTIAGISIAAWPVSVVLATIFSFALLGRFIAKHIMAWQNYRMTGHSSPELYQLTEQRLQTLETSHNMDRIMAEDMRSFIVFKIRESKARTLEQAGAKGFFQRFSYAYLGLYMQSPEQKIWTRAMKQLQKGRADQDYTLTCQLEDVINRENRRQPVLPAAIGQPQDYKQRYLQQRDRQKQSLFTEITARTAIQTESDAPTYIDLTTPTN